MIGYAKCFKNNNDYNDNKKECLLMTVIRNY